MGRPTNATPGSSSVRLTRSSTGHGSHTHHESQASQRFGNSRSPYNHNDFSGGGRGGGRGGGHGRGGGGGSGRGRGSGRGGGGGGGRGGGGGGGGRSELDRVLHQVRGYACLT